MIIQVNVSQNKRYCISYLTVVYIIFNQMSCYEMSELKLTNNGDYDAEFHITWHLPEAHGYGHITILNPHKTETVNVDDDALSLTVKAFVNHKINQNENHEGKINNNIFEINDVPVISKREFQVAGSESNPIYAINPAV